MLPPTKIIEFYTIASCRTLPDVCSAPDRLRSIGDRCGGHRLRNPEVIRVKISSEGAGSITISPVVLQQMSVEELLDVIVPLTGKDPERIDQTLRRGTIVSGSSRFRWDGWNPSPEHIYEWLARYPDPDPTIPLNPEKCSVVRLRGPGHPLEISRETAVRRRWFRRQSFWKTITDGAAVSYDTYSYRDRADIFSLQLTDEHLATLREAAQLLASPTLRTSVTAGRWRFMELLQPR